MKKLFSISCIKCGRPAKHRFSPDLDIMGIGACSKHKHDVEIAYTLILQWGGKDKESLKMLKNHTKDWKQKLGYLGA